MKKIRQYVQLLNSPQYAEKYFVVCPQEYLGKYTVRVKSKKDKLDPNILLGIEYIIKGHR